MNLHKTTTQKFQHTIFKNVKSKMVIKMLTLDIHFFIFYFFKKVEPATALAAIFFQKLKSKFLKTTA